MKIGVVLSGCGYLDGTEIQESVVTLLAIDRAGAEAICMAPDIAQMHVIDHRTGREMPETRNVLTESARITRGDIQDVKAADPDDLDALIFPGGYGAAKNLCNFAVKGDNCQVNPDIAKLVRSMMDVRKPIGVICIAPALMAKVAQENGDQVKLTIGNDGEISSALQKMGVEHIDTKVSDIVVDEAHRIVSTPAYLLGQRVSEVAEGIEKLVKAVMDMME